MFTVFLIILELILVGLRVAAGCYAERIALFAALKTPLTWICIILGIICLVFIVVKIYKEIRGSKSKSDGVNVSFNMDDMDWGSRQ